MFIRVDLQLLLEGFLHVFDPLSIVKFTDKQGQYLAFFHGYAAIHRRPPAEADMQRFFGVTPPSVHRMVIELERRGLIRRQPGIARSIELLVCATDIPPLRHGA